MGPVNFVSHAKKGNSVKEKRSLDMNQAELCINKLLICDQSEEGIYLSRQQRQTRLIASSCRDPASDVMFISPLRRKHTPASRTCAEGLGDVLTFRVLRAAPLHSCGYVSLFTV